MKKGYIKTLLRLCLHTVAAVAECVYVYVYVFVCRCARVYVRVLAGSGLEAEQGRVGGAESAPVQSGPPGKASPIRASLPQPAENRETFPLR